MYELLSSKLNRSAWKMRDDEFEIHALYCQTVSMGYRGEAAEGSGRQRVRASFVNNITLDWEARSERGIHKAVDDMAYLYCNGTLHLETGHADKGLFAKNPRLWQHLGPCLIHKREDANKLHYRYPIHTSFEKSKKVFESFSQEIRRDDWNRHAQADEMHRMWCGLAESQAAAAGSGVRKLCDSFEKHEVHEENKGAWVREL